ncbi:MAG: hypothetical protein IPO21_07855 [Bacteroidales bacterium]|nr:hypothetical protein [Bacteroidales bacterium]
MKLKKICLLTLLSLCILVSKAQQYNSFIDSRDGNVYKTVTIGEQTWFAENLKYLPFIADPKQGSKNTPYYYVLKYISNNLINAKTTFNYNTFGVLYNWTAALNSCPKGWHLPSCDEWALLINYLGGEDLAGGKLKKIDTILWNNPNIGATNESGFSAIPAGSRSYDGTFYGIGEGCCWWTTSEREPLRSYANNVDYAYNMIYQGFYLKEIGLSVRCLND